MQELLDTLAGWTAEGAGVGRAVVVRTFGSAPRPEGAVLLVTEDGRIAGSVSGGCVEGAAAEEPGAQLLRADRGQAGRAEAVLPSASGLGQTGLGGLAAGAEGIEPKLEPFALGQLLGQSGLRLGEVFQAGGVYGHATQGVRLLPSVVVAGHVRILSGWRWEQDPVPTGSHRLVQGGVSSGWPQRHGASFGRPTKPLGLILETMSF